MPRKQLTMSVHADNRLAVPANYTTVLLVLYFLTSNKVRNHGNIWAWRRCWAIDRNVTARLCSVSTRDGSVSRSQRRSCTHVLRLRTRFHARLDREVQIPLPARRQRGVADCRCSRLHIIVDEASADGDRVSCLRIGLAEGNRVSV